MFKPGRSTTGALAKTSASKTTLLQPAVVFNANPADVNRAADHFAREHAVRRLLMYKNTAKNVFAIGLLWWLFPQIKVAIASLPSEQTSNFMTFVGLLLAGSIAGRFAFSYKQTNIHSWIDRLFGHMTTFCLTFGIGLMLEMAVSALGQHANQLYIYPVYWATIMVFTAIILCDCWDALRLAHADSSEDA